MESSSGKPMYDKSKKVVEKTDVEKNNEDNEVDDLM